VTIELVAQEIISDDMVVTVNELLDHLPNAIIAVFYPGESTNSNLQAAGTTAQNGVTSTLIF
jgi:hypothetical protein